MIQATRYLVVLASAAALLAIDGTAFAQGKGKDKDKDKQQQHEQQGGPKEKGGGKEKAKKAKHENGKALVGDKVKKNGKHKLDQKGKHTAFVDVKDGKIAGVSVENADKGNVPVKKYKTNQKVVDGGYGMVPASMQLVQYMGTTYIGYAYWDDYYQEEVIYWFPYDMIYDGDTGAIEYVPAY
jgi:hypothetical protein